MGPSFDNATLQNKQVWQRSGLRLDAAELDLGRRYVDERVEVPFRLINPTDRPVQIERFQMSCDCLGIEPRSLVVGPRSQSLCVATIQLKPLAFQGFAAQPSSTEFTAVTSTKDIRDSTFRVRCMLSPTLVAKQGIIDVGVISRRQTSVLASLQFATSQEVPWVNADSVAPWQAKVVSQGCIADRNDHLLQVEIPRAVALGRIVHSVTLTPYSRDAKPLPSTEISLLGEIVEDVIAEPREIRLGYRIAEEEFVEAVALRSLTDRPFLVLSVQSNVTTVQCLALDPAKTLWSIRGTVQIESAPPKVTATIQDLGDGAQHTLEIPIQWSVRPSVVEQFPAVREVQP